MSSGSSTDQASIDQNHPARDERFQAVDTTQPVATDLAVWLRLHIYLGVPSMSDRIKLYAIHDELVALRAGHRALMERCAEAEAKLTALREQVARGEASGDRCQFCLGTKGGEPGAEQTVGGALACAECAELVQAAIENSAQAPAAAVTDAEAAELAAMFHETSASAAEIVRQEESGERVGLVTPVGGTVTDPDELDMHRRLAEQNIAICSTCRNTGWRVRGEKPCECPYGWFLVTKTSQTKE